MNILITGANGFLGKHLVRFLRNDHNLFLIHRRPEGNLKEVIVMDLENVETVTNSFRYELLNTQVDVVIHCAAILVNTGNIFDFSVFEKNHAITKSLIHIVKTCKVKKLINLSTIGVYPNISGQYNELSAVAPSHNSECMYSLSKICSEELFRFFLSDTSVVINLRLGQTYGPGMRNDRIYAMMQEELRTKNKISVRGNGERVSNFVTVDYFLQTMNKIIRHSLPSGTYNLGEKNCSYLSLAESIIEKYGNPDSRSELEAEGVKAKVYIDSSKLINALG